MKRTLLSLFPVSMALYATACGGGNSDVKCPPAVMLAPAPDAPKPPTAEKGAPSVDEAKKFIEQIEADLKKLWVARDQAAWVQNTYITDDTDAVGARAEEATSEYVTKAIKAAERFRGVKMPEDIARKFYFLNLAQVVPAPSDAKDRAELAEVGVWLSGTYGKGKYCPTGKTKLKGKDGQTCFTLGDLSKVLDKSRDYDELLEAWTGWHSISVGMRDKYSRYVELGNKGAKEIGFADMGALWRSGYDMKPEEFEADNERMWSEVKPLYDELHCYVRTRLAKKYGKDKVPEKGPIPAHILGNMWAQEWQKLFDLLVPYPNEPSLNVTKTLEKKFPMTPPAGMKDDAKVFEFKNENAKKFAKIGENFFVSLGMDPLPKSFWERSQFTKPRDRDVICHASAWDVTWADDLRIKMCIDPTEEELITVHHELGHNYYQHAYRNLPVLLQNGANDGFHEAIGDTIALSVTPEYFKKIGLLDKVVENPKARLNQQMKMALDKIAFLPFGYLIDKWRWDVFSGKTPKDKYNEAWWALRTKYQGVSAPVARSEKDFDPGAKFHVPGSTPYVRYFLARIYQFQFHKALCKASGHTGPLDTCSIFGNKDAGKKFQTMLEMGQSRPWPEAMKAVTGEGKGDATAMVEYFAPLREYLKEQNKGQTCGW